MHGQAARYPTRVTSEQAAGNGPHEQLLELRGSIDNLDAAIIHLLAEDLSARSLAGPSVNQTWKNCLFFVVQSRHDNRLDSLIYQHRNAHQDKLFADETGRRAEAEQLPRVGPRAFPCPRRRGPDPVVL